MFCRDGQMVRLSTSPEATGREGERIRIGGHGRRHTTSSRQTHVSAPLICSRSSTFDWTSFTLGSHQILVIAVNQATMAQVSDQMTTYVDGCYVTDPTGQDCCGAWGALTPRSRYFELGGTLSPRAATRAKRDRLR
jgi:hypothetical protein